MRSINWKSWGGDRAVGFGTYEYEPAAGEPPGSAIGPIKARAKFSKIRTCDGRERYQQLTVNYGDGFNKNAYSGEYFPCGSL